MARGKKKSTEASAQLYDHKDKERLLRPDVGLQAQFRSKRAPKNYRYNLSLDSELSWDINADRAEALIPAIEGLSYALNYLVTFK